MWKAKALTLLVFYLWLCSGGGESLGCSSLVCSLSFSYVLYLYKTPCMCSCFGKLLVTFGPSFSLRAVDNLTVIRWPCSNWVLCSNLQHGVTFPVVSTGPRWMSPVLARASASSCLNKMSIDTAFWAQPHINRKGFFSPSRASLGEKTGHESQHQRKCSFHGISPEKAS